MRKRGAPRRAAAAASAGVARAAAARALARAVPVASLEPATVWGPRPDGRGLQGGFGWLSEVRLCDPCARVSRVCPGSPRCLYRYWRPLLSRPRGAVDSGPAAVLAAVESVAVSAVAWSCLVRVCCWVWARMVVRFVRVIRVPASPVCPVCPVCVPAPPGVFLLRG